MASRHSPIGAIDGVYIADPATGTPLLDRNTYSAVITIVPAATATDVLEIIGATGKTVEVLSIDVHGIAAATLGFVFDVVKRSAANTVGTSTSATIIPSCSTDPAATAVIKGYTANPTLGAAVGTVISRRMTVFSATATTARADPPLITSGQQFQPFSLFSAAETLCVNLQGAATVPTSLTFTVRLAEYTTYAGR